MPRSDYVNCAGCGRHVGECGELSHERLCVQCGDERRVANLVQLVTGEGPYYDHWNMRTIMAARKRLLASGGG